MRIAIMGSGGLGGYFGARLAHGGADVHFIARGKHLQAMKSDGLRIEGPSSLNLPRVNATDDPATHIMGGVGYVATTIDRPGVIRQTGPMQRLLFGEFDGSRSPRGEALLAACLAGGINAEFSEHILREIWQKYVFLVGLSGTTTTMRRTIGPIRENPQTRAFLLDVMREVVAVGRAQGVDLAEDYAEVRLKLADDVSPDMTSSMHHDLERGNRLEVRWLAGGVVELGRAKGVPTPLNRAIADILALHTAGKSP